MCGIFGVIGKQAKEDIKAANRTISHRGPDAEGYWFDENHHVALCHRRLAILDLTAAGAQPMGSASGRFVLIFNGEIYNFLELKKKLNKTDWHGTSDTEVLLACFEAWGVDTTLTAIEGMYSIALWDTQAQTLTLIRDRLGEKPLYYGLVDGTLAFSSELKPFISLFKNKLEISPTAVAEFFRRSCIPKDASIFQGIHKLPAGHSLTISLVDIKHRQLKSPSKYWALKDLPLGHLQISASQALIELEEKMSRAVQQQMIADVPLGAFLSGGVDSSLVVALMQSLSSKKIKTFSIGFGDRDYNEADYAKSVAQHLGTEHEELYVTQSDLLAQVPLLSGIYDEPFADSSQIPTLLVSQMARKHVKVALSGDGGDELFAGYNRHLFAAEKWERLSQVPVSLRKIAANVLTAFPPSAWQNIFKIISVKAAQPHEKIFKLAEVLKSSSMADFYKSVSAHGESLRVLRQSNFSLSEEDWDIHSALEMCLADAQWYMPDDVLVKVDRASMAHSLETRAPFLNKDIVEMAFALPMDLKIRDGQTKWILRELLYKHVPKQLIDRPKMGFGVPLDSWLRGELKEWAWSLLNPDALQRQDILDPDQVLAKWNQHQRGLRNWQTELWDILMFLSWRKQFGL
jgi:asparagine synthase (glutamine-hydrolysing)